MLQSVLAGAGAWPRDDEDRRLLREVREGGGRIGSYGPEWRGRYEAWHRERDAAVAAGESH